MVVTLKSVASTPPTERTTRDNVERLMLRSFGLGEPTAHRRTNRCDVLRTFRGAYETVRDTRISICPPNCRPTTMPSIAFIPSGYRATRLGRRTDGDFRFWDGDGSSHSRPSKQIHLVHFH